MFSPVEQRVCVVCNGLTLDSGKHFLKEFEPIFMFCYLFSETPPPTASGPLPSLKQEPPRHKLTAIPEQQLPSPQSSPLRRQQQQQPPTNEQQPSGEDFGDGGFYVERIVVR